MLIVFLEVLTLPFYIAGCFVLFQATIHLLKLAYVWLAHMCCPINFIQKYGANSYVLITGSSDGLGKGLAKTFAKLGFNIILVARNLAKLEAVKAELIKMVPLCQVEIYICDFSKSFSPQFYQNLFDFSSNFDVSIVVNNVGTVYPGKNNIMTIQNKSPEILLEVMATNMLPQALIRFYYEKKLIEDSHKKPFAFLDVSSISSLWHCFTLDVYGATKTFNYYFCTSRGHCLKPKGIDNLCYRAGAIDTIIMQKAEFFKKLSKGKLALSSDQAANSIVKAIGRVSVSTAHIIHSINAGSFVIVNYFYDSALIQWNVRKIVKKFCPTMTPTQG